MFNQDRLVSGQSDTVLFIADGAKCLVTEPMAEVTEMRQTFGNRTSTVPQVGLAPPDRLVQEARGVSPCSVGHRQIVLTARSVHARRRVQVRMRSAFFP